MLMALVLAATMPPVDQDAAGNRIEPLIAAAAKAADDTEAPQLLCTSDRAWCAEIVSDDGRTMLSVFDGTAPGDAPRWNYELMAQDDRATFALWPRIVRVAPPSEARIGRTVYVGVETRVSTGYSGGGASASRLSLIRVDSSGEPPIGEMLDVPLSGSASIRACFSEADMKQRAEACHDEYGFDATLGLAAPIDGLPVFHFRTRATRFPGPVSRNMDSLEAGPLTKKDLVTVTDPICSYRRTVRFNPATDRYEFDTPAPDCSEFTVP